MGDEPGRRDARNSGPAQGVDAAMQAGARSRRSALLADPGGLRLTRTSRSGRPELRRSMGASPDPFSTAAGLLSHQRRSPIAITHPLRSVTPDDRPQLEEGFCHIVYSVKEVSIARGE